MHGAAYKNLPKVVKFLAAKGAKIEVWNSTNKFGWTPLTIADGYRFGNFKPSPDTEAAVREVMIAAGVTPPKTVVAKTQQIDQSASGYGEHDGAIISSETTLTESPSAPLIRNPVAIMR